MRFKTKKRQFIKEFLKLFIPIFLILVLIVSGIFYDVYSTHKNNVILKNQNILNLMQMRVDQSIVENVNDLLYLKSLVESAVKNNGGFSPEEKYFLTHTFYYFAKNIKNYNQVRFLNAKGKEVIRVNYRDHSAQIVPESKLQEKANRYYFKKAISLKNNQVYISPFDLNVENKKIEKPFVPMIRFATPVMNKQGKLDGVVILNYFGGLILDQLRMLQKNILDPVMLTTHDGCFIYSPQMEDRWGFMLPSRKDKTVAKKYPGLWQKMQADPSASLLKTKQGIFLIENLSKLAERFKYDDLHIDLICFISCKRLLQPLFTYYLLSLGLVFILAILLGILLSIIETRRMLFEQELTFFSENDSLTGIANRYKFLKEIEKELKRTERSHHPFALIMLDIDHFKKINDQYGHLIGDKVLKLLTKNILDVIRSVDTIARFGGEEFVILLPDTSLDSAMLVAEKVREKIATTKVPIYRASFYFTISLGVAVWHKDDKEVQAVIKRADDALYLAKQQGRNLVKSEIDITH